ncbi:sulfotransferase family protein [Coleofasciculus sp. F4-SAH-05]|uniref:sulfotransferase family protein n=1 Tax=Coleofasciculus sp. F4-SAH-05 TaxID=3069525 RepID=UPI0032F42938
MDTIARNTFMVVKQKLQIIRSFYLPSLTRSIRTLPSFIIVGAQKGGTTSLNGYLKSHPDICMARGKETWFFDKHYEKGISYYRLHFPLKISSFLNPRLVVGEASPSYIYNPRVPERIYTHFPNCKIIILLRDPIERAYSHYKHMRRIGFEDLATFESAIEKEAERTCGELEKIMENGFYFSQSREFFSYLGKGIYYPQVKAYLDKFGKDRVLVVDSNSFFLSEKTIMSEIEKFIGVKPHNYQDFPVWNKGDKSRLPEATRNQLKDFYEPHNEMLFDLLGRKLSWA